MTIHAHSLQAYTQERDSGQFSKREHMILHAMHTGDSMTDRQLMHILQFPEPGCIRPRVNRLLELGVIEECGETKCIWTRKTVRLIRLATKEARQEEMAL